MGAELLTLAAGSLALRPYVFTFLAMYLVAAIGAWGTRRALAFTALAASCALAAEFSSTRTGIPFGLYHYTGVTRGQELYVSNVPAFDPISFSFLAWASLGMARLLVQHRVFRGRAPGRVTLALLTGLLMMWLDVVIDPLAVRGDRWFLGRIFFYPVPGPYFGVPLSNFAGWALTGTVIAGLWLWLEPRMGGAPPAWGGRLPGPHLHPVLIYYLVLGFNLVVTAVVGEPTLFWAGVVGQAPLAAGVVCCLALSPARRAGSGFDAGHAPGGDTGHDR